MQVQLAKHAAGTQTAGGRKQTNRRTAQKRHQAAAANHSDEEVSGEGEADSVSAFDDTPFFKKQTPQQQIVTRSQAKSIGKRKRTAGKASVTTFVHDVDEEASVEEGDRARRELRSTKKRRLN